MKQPSYFEKFYKRLMVEGIIRSIVSGFIVGFSANFVAAFTFWAFDIQNFWLTIIIGILVGALAAVVFYFKIFKPDTKAIARRIDRLGLEERLITMTELENDDSYIAMRQREDAKFKLSNVDISGLKFKVSTAIIVACCCTFVVGSAMTTVAALSESGVLKKGSEIIMDITEGEPELVSVSYMVDGDIGGFIEGEPEQLIEKGSSTTTVVAVAEDGFMFTGWSDGKKDPSRYDAGVEEDVIYVAMFMEIPDGDGQPGDGDPGEGQPSPNDDPQRQEKPSDPSQDNKDPSASGQQLDIDKIIDGKTYYGDLFDQYYDDAVAILTAGGDIPADIRAFIENYMDILNIA